MIYVKDKLANIVKNRDLFIKNGVGVEISLYDTDYIRDVDKEELREIKKILEENEVDRTAHLPIFGLDLGTKDSYIRDYSRDIIVKAMEIAFYLGVKRAVIHSTQTYLTPIHARKKWYSNFKKEFGIINERAKKLGITLLMENVWEKDVDFFDKLFIDFEDVALCFDIGHANVYYKKNIEEFLKKFGEKITHLHIHDNKLKNDDHLHLGDGVIDFRQYFYWFNRYIENYTVTLETNIGKKLSRDIEIIRDLEGI